MQNGNVLKDKSVKEKPLIFVTNDDGIHAPGIRLLIDRMRALGRVVVVAPDKPQSGTAHAITIHTPLRLKFHAGEPDYEEYSCNGTPADCVKLGFKVVMKRHPDLLVSGINHGSNSSVSIIYSGTMAAVFEGAMAGVPSIGFSFNNYSPDAALDSCGAVVSDIVEKVLEDGMPEGVCLNVNIPDVPLKELKGIRICRQAGGTWQEDFDERVDPIGRKYYWLKGIFVKTGNGEDTDEWAMENHYVAVVPVHFDFTSYEAISLLKYWEKDA
ncbi:MAG: 5'/3'-nucleotidase SurE [Bacteroidetes bacterium]|nr:5'/3'-nucleotidase SurE [Bacteroidota bacterium]